jgi:phosphomannomutase/phosphoglucomutase
MFFAEGWYGFDDALYGAARLLRIVADSGKSVSELLADVPRFASTPEIRVDCPDDVKFGVVERAWPLPRVARGDRRRRRAGALRRRVGAHPRVEHPAVLVMRFEARTEERVAEIRAEMEGWLATQGVAVAGTRAH